MATGVQSMARAARTVQQYIDIRRFLRLHGGEPGSLNHIGVEVEDFDAVQAMIDRANDLGLDQKVCEDVSCCFAVQDKPWVKGPENDWEFYFVKGDAPTMSYAGDDEASRWEDDQEEHETVPAAAPTCC